MIFPFFRMNREQPLTSEKLMEFINLNKRITAERYLNLWNAYQNDYDILHKRQKPAWKPDNRITVNHARYITDTFEGFFSGIPVKITSDDESVQDFLQYVNSYANVNGRISEVSTLCAIFGRAHIVSYLDKYKEIKTTTLSPMESFMIYDDSMDAEKLYFVRYWYDDYRKKESCSVADSTKITYYDLSPNPTWTGEEEHGFPDVPAVEFKQNITRTGIFEDQLSMINAYCNVLSEKANDVEVFADAYMKILGFALDEKTVNFLRDNKIINSANATENTDVGFLERPSGDTIEEHFLDRVEQDIYDTAKVLNPHDNNFSASSGIAIRYKMSNMRNMAGTKERLMRTSLRELFHLILGHAIPNFPDEAWLRLHFDFRYAWPTNDSEEADTAAKLSGITSKRTQLRVLSLVDDVDAELEQIEKEQDELSYSTDYPTNRLTAEEEDDAEDEDENKES